MAQVLQIMVGLSCGNSRSKSWKLYDSCLQRAIYYNWKIADYFPGESPVDKTAQLTVANGKVTWKWIK